MVKFNVEPTQTGELLEAIGVAGSGFTITVAVPAKLVHPPTVTVKLYVPADNAEEANAGGFLTAAEYAFGPVQVYVAPATFGVVKVIVDPKQTGVVAVGTGVAGVVLTATATVPNALVHPLTVTVKLYVPAITGVAPGRVGFCNALINALGPVQLYVAPATVGVVNVIVVPVQTGVVAVTVGAVGIGLTTTTTVPAALVQPPTVTVKLYVPAERAVDANAGGFLTAAA